MFLPLVSVIIPVYNTENYVCLAIQSALSQTYTNVEIIVVDDGSTDHSCERIENTFVDNSNVRLFKKNNGGASSARNEGMKYVRGEYILFLDSDDTLVPTAIEKLVATILEYDADAAYPCVFSEISKAGVLSSVELYYDTKNIMSAEQFAIQHMIMEGTAWRCSSVLYRTAIIQEHKVHFSNGHTAEDYLFNLEFLFCANRVAVERNKTLCVRKRLGSVTSSYRPDLFELYLYLDKQTIAFLKKSGLSEEESRLTANSLLGRNLLAYYMKEISTGTPKNGFWQSYRTAKRNIKADKNYHKALALVVKNSMYFTTGRKRIFAQILAWMLTKQLYLLSAICIRIVQSK